MPPFFEGWWQNADGSVTYSFGYYNPNSQEAFEIPIGPNNYLEPEQFNGRQPTYFPPGRGTGVFTVDVPPELRDTDVVWTLRTHGRTYSVPGRATSEAYELGFTPMALGSMPPSLRLEPGGQAGYGPQGITSPPLTATVGTPLPLRIWAADDRSQREDEVDLRVRWAKHQGPPVPITFSADTATVEVGENEASTTVTFSAPGEYLLRVVVDNFDANDSGAGDQCCWTNGFVPVRVRPRD